MKQQRVVVNAEEVLENIRHYNVELSDQPKLSARIKQHPAWYAYKDKSGLWSFGPSKFIGYAKANAKTYLSAYARTDGRETEPALARWFVHVDLASPLGKELSQAFIAFASIHGKTPNANWRVSVQSDAITATQAAAPSLKEIDARIASNPEICGGRARIAGTRMPVSDLVAMFAEGADRKTILEDFPYLTDADITAALSYAAMSTNHFVLRAA